MSCNVTKGLKKLSALGNHREVRVGKEYPKTILEHICI